MTKTVLFLDSNIFLHYQFPDQINWCDLLDADHVTLVIAPVVIRELDAHKALHPIKRLRQRASKVISRLSTLLEMSDDIEIRPSTTLFFEPNEPLLDFAQHRLQPAIQDDQLLASILAYREHHPETHIVLATADMGLKIKAKSRRIETLTLPEELQLPEEPDPDAKHIKDLEQQVHRLQQRLPQLSLSFDDGSDHLRFTLTPDPVVPERELHEWSSALKQKHPYMTLPPTLPPAVNRPLSVLSTVDILGMKSITQEEVDHYNHRLDEFYVQAQDYFVERAHYETQPQRTLGIKLMLRNTGTCPADDIDLFLHFPDGFDLYDEGNLPEPPEMPEPPAKPKTPEERLKAGFDFILPPLYQSPFPMLPAPRGNVSGPKIRRTNSYDVTFHVENLKHGLSAPFSLLYILFRSADYSQSFRIDYRINAANLLQEVTGGLHVIVEKAT